MTTHEIDQYPLDIDDTEVMASIKYRYSPGYRGRAPDLHQPGEPPEGAEFDVEEIFVGTEAVPKWFFDAVMASSKLIDWLHDHHQEDGPDPDDAYERMRDDADMGFNDGGAD